MNEFDGKVTIRPRYDLAPDLVEIKMTLNSTGQSLILPAGAKIKIGDHTLESIQTEKSMDGYFMTRRLVETSNPL